MANNYEQFSEIIECHTRARRDKLLAMLQVAEENQDINVCEYKPESETGVWIYIDEWGDTDELAEVLQSYLRKFDLDEHIIISIAYSCSKPRPGEFGGWAMGITKDKIECIDAREAMKILLAKG